MRVELRDHSKPCEHAAASGFVATPYDEGPWKCAIDGCPGGALRVFTYDGVGQALTANKRGSGSFAGRRWQRWVEWLEDERT